MARELLPLAKGQLLDEELELSLGELCRACHMELEELEEWLAEGVVEPLPGGGRRFAAISVRRVQRARRLRDDLGLNAAGAALVLDLLEEIEWLRQRLARFEG
ncbi:MAG: hypothetical protein KatS3mg124_1342 [Porticoccaceae bacterium]|nr:MAG: hypothetical protein KatS3mg124_1342 [Porticoccaceae bacterium]